MKFLKKNITWIIAIIAGIAISSGISVYATSTYLASDISYKSTNVANALNDLYILSSDKYESRISNLENEKLIVQTGTISQQTFDKGAGKQIDVIFPNAMKDANYLISVERINGGYSWSLVDFQIIRITNTGFSISCWNNDYNTTAYTGFRWSIIGK